MTTGGVLSVGWEEIDSQHREVLESLDVLRQAVERGDPSGTRAALEVLRDMVVLHFATEQDLMDRSAFPDRAAHKGAHDLFLRDLQALSAELEASAPTETLLDWVSRRIAGWLAFHIETNDVPLGRHLSTLRRRSGTVTAGQKHRQS